MVKQLWILIFIIASFVVKVSEAKLTPPQLSCEYHKNSSMVDIQHPRLAWINTAETGGSSQI